MARGRSAGIISTIQWIRTCRLSIKNSLSRTPSGPSSAEGGVGGVREEMGGEGRPRVWERKRGLRSLKGVGLVVMGP